MSQQATALEHVWEDWQRALVIVAHPDDVEFGAAAAVARWTNQGKNVVYCMVTSGEAGIDAMTPEEARRVRRDEEIESARIVGVDTVEFLDLPDGVIEGGVELRRVLAAPIRRHRPDVVVTLNFRDTWGSTMANQSDHIVVGRASVHAAQDAGNRWIFPEQLEGPDALEPWGGVRQVWATSSPESQHGVDTSATFERGVASLEAHRAYINGLGWKDFDAAQFLGQMSRPVGQRLGVEHGVPFEVFDVG